MKENNSKNIIILLVGIIIVILIVLCILFFTGTISFNSKANNNNKQSSGVVEGNNENSNNVNEPKPKEPVLGENDTFSSSTESGQVDVLGYAEVTEINESFDSDGETESYIFFHILDIKSNDFLSYIDSLKGNSFVKEKAIGIGCVDDNIIRYANDSDQEGLKAYELTKDVSSKIINSTSSNPIKLRLNRMPLTYGSGAPSCYSHITTIEVIN